MAVNPIELDRYHELAEFLRSRRARLSPEEAGLPRGSRRRTPGLRREEVAMLAGVSPEWYTWLEQGRGITVSGQLLESLARVLQLDSVEREHLFLLALRQPPPVETFTSPEVSPGLQQLLDQMGSTPASVVDVRLNVVAWNAAHCAVYGDYTAMTQRERNLIWRIFSVPPGGRTNDDWEHLAEVMLAQFRAGYARFINDPWWAEQIAELSLICPDFQRLWSRHDVINRSEGRKIMHHPVVGDLSLDFLWLQPVDSQELRLLIHSPTAGTDTAAKIERLMSLPAEQRLPAHTRPVIAGIVRE